MLEESSFFSVFEWSSTMAKMHSRGRGKSGSTRPAVRTKPLWLRYTEKEIELLVTKLAKEGKTMSEVGLILRDSYGIPDVKTITGRKIRDILVEKKLEPKIPDDLFSLMRKLLRLQSHVAAHKQDNACLRGLHLTQSKIKRLVDYYKRAKRLPIDWKYDTQSIKLYAQ